MGAYGEFKNEMIHLHPELKDYYESAQYLLSEKIIEIMMGKGFSEEIASKLLDMDIEYFARLTSGDNSINTVEYDSTISKLQNI